MFIRHLWKNTEVVLIGLGLGLWGCGSRIRSSSKSSSRSSCSSSSSSGAIVAIVRAEEGAAIRGVVGEQ